MYELRENDSLNLVRQEKQLSELRAKVNQLSNLDKLKVPFNDLAKEIQANYSELEEVTFFH